MNDSTICLKFIQDQFDRGMITNSQYNSAMTAGLDDGQDWCEIFQSLNILKGFLKYSDGDQDGDQDGDHDGDGDHPRVGDRDVPSRFGGNYGSGGNFVEESVPNNISWGQRERELQRNRLQWEYNLSLNQDKKRQKQGEIEEWVGKLTGMIPQSVPEKIEDITTKIQFEEKRLANFPENVNIQKRVKDLKDLLAPWSEAQRKYDTRKERIDQKIGEFREEIIKLDQEYVELKAGEPM